MPESRVGGRAMDARPDRMDLRDRPFLPRLVSLPPMFPDRDFITDHLADYATSYVLDQGQDGACTGFGLAAAINYLLWKQSLEAPPQRKKVRKTRPPAGVSPAMLYHLAQIYDEWTGEDYDGSSCRGAMKGWQRHGVCSDKLWIHRDKKGNVGFFPPLPGWQEDAATRTLGAYYRIDRNSVFDMQAAIAEVGAIYCSADVHQGWIKPSTQNAALGALPVIRIPVGQRESGGHAFALVGYLPEGFIVQNSWGTGWGYKGFAVLPYEDWVRHGTDAWVAVLGAPVLLTPAQAASRSMSSLTLRDVGDGKASWFWQRTSKKKTLPPDVAPLDEHEALNYSVVLGNNGIPENRFNCVRDAEAAVEDIAFNFPKAALATLESRRLAIYAHGGLNSEGDSIKRVRALAPYFLRNGIYPIFITWRTGFLESISGILDNAVSKFFGLGPEQMALGWWSNVVGKLKDVKDRAIEVAAEEFLVKAVWTQMKDNARKASAGTGGMVLVAKHLQRLKDEFGDDLELHLVGHSAGSILLGHFLGLLKDGPRPKSCSLFAPACSIPFAVDHYKPALETGILPSLNIDGLTNRRELADSVGPYGKSLLYLVSRALEEMHKMPLLGMQAASVEEEETPDLWNKDAGEQTGIWRAFARQHVDFAWLNDDQVDDGEEKIPSAHGSFDNDVAIITKTLTRILGGQAPTVKVVDLHNF